LALYGMSAFLRPRIATGWPAWAGLALLVTSITGILARTSETLATDRIDKGGIVGWGGSEALRRTLGPVGTWIILAALIPVGVLFVTQLSYGVLSRALGIRLSRLRPADRPKSSAETPVAAGASPSAWTAPAIEPPPLVVKEPAKPKSSLAEKGLAWQETFD